MKNKSLNNFILIFFPLLFFPLFTFLQYKFNVGGNNTSIDKIFIHALVYMITLGFFIYNFLMSKPAFSVFPVIIGLCLTIMFLFPNILKSLYLSLTSVLGIPWYTNNYLIFTLILIYILILTRR